MNAQVSGKYFKRLYEAMLPAFPDYNEYERFLRLNMQTRLEEIVSSKKMQDVHFEVLEWFERYGRLEALVKMAFEARPRNEELAELVNDIPIRPSPMTEAGDAQIDDYKVNCILGNGRMSIVYLGTDNLGRSVVIKVLDRLFRSNGDSCQKFAHEAKILAKLNHEAIVPIYQYGEFNHELYMVMPFMSGGSLRKRMNKPMLLPEVLNIYRRIGPAVDYMHRKGIVHQNINPENILFDDEELAYLADFGMARLVESTPAANKASNPRYLSPEQFQPDRLPDAHMDVYALGVMLYEMLARELPFQAYSRKQLHPLHAHQAVPDILQVRSDCPAGLQPILEKAMAKDPAERFANAAELTQALEDACLKSPATSPQVKSPLATKNIMTYGEAAMLGAL